MWTAEILLWATAEQQSLKRSKLTLTGSCASKSSQTFSIKESQYTQRSKPDCTAADDLVASRSTF